MTENELRLELKRQVRIILIENKTFEVKDDASLRRDLKFDSLDLVEGVMVAERLANIDIPDHDAEKLDSINDIVEYLREKDCID